MVQNICTVGVKSVYAKWPNYLLCAGPRAANGRITVGCVTKHLNYCVNCIIYRVFEEKNSKFWELMASVIARIRVHMNMCRSLDGYRNRVV